MARWLVSSKPYVAQIAVQACLAGMNIITKVSLDDGMNHFVFVAYTLAVATVAIAPVAYFLERNERPAMTCAIFWQIFALALAGATLFQNLYCCIMAADLYAARTLKPRSRAETGISYI